TPARAACHPPGTSGRTGNRAAESGPLAGLDASTVTPGRAAPEVSRTTPAIALVPCASAMPDATSTNAPAAPARRIEWTRPRSTRDATRPMLWVAVRNLDATMCTPLIDDDVRARFAGRPS